MFGQQYCILVKKVTVISEAWGLKIEIDDTLHKSIKIVQVYIHNCQEWQ